ncbi:hypothetical protein OIU78_014847 [Salix suchowensis]|nr:hypothetical protein OIU78_014847 [Salix suchowensis]
MSQTFNQLDHFALLTSFSHLLKKEVVEVLEFIAKREGIELPYPLAEKIADNSKNNLRQAIRSFEPPGTEEEDQEILTGWEDDIANIAKDMVEGQSPKQHEIQLHQLFT